MEHPGMARLRDHMHRHNRWVLLLTLLTFAAAAALWTALYFLVWWLFLLGGTAVNSIDFHPAASAVLGGFSATAILLCAIAWITRRLRPNEVPEDRKGLAGHLLDLLLAVPRVTLAIFGTGAAAARLNSAELEQAWRLLRRMYEAPKPVPVQALPVDIPDSESRNRIILALQLSGLIETRPTSAGPVLAFRNQEARRLAQERVRLNL